MQFEHDIDLDKSYVRPSLAANGVPQKLFMSVLLEVGKEHEYLKALLAKIPKKENHEHMADVGKIEGPITLEESEAPLLFILGST